MRVPKPFFRAQTQNWYVQLGKRQINLGPSEATAWDKYHALMAGREDLSSSTTAAALIDSFLEWCQRNNAPRTYEIYSWHLQSFASHIGKRLRVADVKPYHITRWVGDRHGKAKANTRHRAIRTVQRAFNWAVKQGVIDRSPTAHIETPTPERREVIVSPAEWQTIMAAAKDQEFRDLLTILRETGCRPQEARQVEAGHFDREHCRLILPRLMSKGKRISRVVYLNEVAFEVTVRLVERHTEGAILRDTNGAAWTKNAINCRFRRLAKKLNKPGLCAYAIRHTWATEALQNGIDPITAATLMGHVDATMIAKTYQHLSKNSQYLQAAANAARTAGA